MKKILLIVISLMLLLAACSPAQPSALPPQQSPSASEPPLQQSPSASAPSGMAQGSGLEGVRAVLKQQPIQPVNEDFVSGVNSFGFKSASLLYGDDANLAFSPLSLELALAMTHTGAAGKTASEMKSALSLEGVGDDEIVSACRSLIWRANTGGMECANSIWVDKAYPFSEDFLSGCTNDFMADAFPLVIPGAMDNINAWASEKTHGKIDKIISKELNRETALVLCNALYFLGDWDVPFEANDTYEEDFTTPSGPVKASFMHSERGAAYYKNDKFSMLSLPFKSDSDEGKYAMAFLLPAEGSTVSDMLSSLDAAGFSAALTGLKNQTVKIKLPKFEYSFYASFVDTLKSLGMIAAFGPADLSKMTGGANGLYIADVLHKCYIKVDELGAEAAAVTAVIVDRAGYAMPPENAAEFYADRPFLFAIYSQEDGAIAFLGAVNDPTQE